VHDADGVSHKMLRTQQGRLPIDSISGPRK